MSHSKQYEGYGWIKVKKHKEDVLKSDYDNYVDLEEHHIAETTFLIAEVRKLAALLDEKEEELRARNLDDWKGIGNA